MSEESLSLVALYDDIIRLQTILVDGCEEEFIRYVVNQEDCRIQWHSAVEECSRLQSALSNSQKELSASENKLQCARKMVDVERKRSRRIEVERQALERQVALIRDLLVPQQNKLNDETKEKLAFLNSTLKSGRNSRAAHDEDRLRTITELDTTGSILSDLSISRSEDDLDTSYLRSGKRWKKVRPSLDSGDAQSAKRRRSSSSSGVRFSIANNSLYNLPIVLAMEMKDEFYSELPAMENLTWKRTRENFTRLLKSNKIQVASEDHLVATTTVRVSRDGPVNAMCTIETGSNKENVKVTAPPIPQITKTRPSAPTLNEILGQEETGHSKGHAMPPPPQKMQSCHLPPLPPSSFSRRGCTDSDEWSGSQKTKGRQSGGWLAPDIGIAFEAVKRINSRQHCFTEKTVIKSEECTPCGKKMNFGKMAVKCCDCKVMSHPECKEGVPLPCVPVAGTPTTKKGQKGSIADYVPLSAPLVPSIVIHCINEVESRGFSEVGIYRVPGSDKEVKSLKEKFLRGKGAPNLRGYDIHVVCGVLKDFLRNLSEPLITRALWHDFARAAQVSDHGDLVALLYQVISDLPKPNRDTLAYLILHLQKVASCRECKMPVTNLAKVFGPTISGYSCVDVSPSSMYQETRTQQEIIEALLRIPSEYWSSFINIENDALFTPKSKVLGTPSTDNVRTPLTVKENKAFGRMSSRRFFSVANTPNVTPRSNRWKGKKFFDTAT